MLQETRTQLSTEMQLHARTTSDLEAAQETLSKQAITCKRLNSRMSSILHTLCCTTAVLEDIPYSATELHGTSPSSEPRNSDSAHVGGGSTQETVELDQVSARVEEAGAALRVRAHAAIETRNCLQSQTLELQAQHDNLQALVTVWQHCIIPPVLHLRPCPCAANTTNV
jgi:hypothetical protein